MKMLEIQLADSVPYVLSIFGSFCFFHGVCLSVEWIFLLDFWSELDWKSAKQNKRRLTIWRRRNTTISLVHSVITGTWSISAFLLHPDMWKDITFSKAAGLANLVLFSIGYFLYDAADMLKNDRSRRTYELLTHHIITVIAFSCTLVSKKYYAYAAVALLMELNSVFLHTRVLINMHGCTKATVLYRITSLFNIATFIVFRFFVVAWMTRWILDHRTEINDLFYLVGTLGLAVLFVMNIFLFCRILVADHFYLAVKKEKLTIIQKDDFNVR